VGSDEPTLLIIGRIPTCGEAGHIIHSHRCRLCRRVRGLPPPSLTAGQPAGNTQSFSLRLCVELLGRPKKSPAPRPGRRVDTRQAAARAAPTGDGGCAREWVGVCRRVRGLPHMHKAKRKPDEGQGGWRGGWHGGLSDRIFSTDRIDERGRDKKKPKRHRSKTGWPGYNPERNERLLAN